MGTATAFASMPARDPFPRHEHSYLVRNEVNWIRLQISIDIVSNNHIAFSGMMIMRGPGFAGSVGSAMMTLEMEANELAGSHRDSAGDTYRHGTARVPVEVLA